MMPRVKRKIKRETKAILDSARMAIGIHILAPITAQRGLKRCLSVESLTEPAFSCKDVMKREFTMLGKQVCFEREIDWEADFEGGSWPIWHASMYSVFYKDDFGTKDYKIHGDVKRAWDLNKHLHFLNLARAYFRTRDKIYDAELCSQLNDWIIKHPYPMGIGWSEPLIVAQRSISWIVAYNLGCLSSLTRLLAKSLFVHGRDLRRRLELNPSGWNTNHVIGELVALFLIGRTLGMDSWEEEALALLQNELDRQILPDGVHYEQSSGYHRYVLEFLSLLRFSGMDVKWFTQKIVKMTNFLEAIATSRGDLPLLSDQDGSKVWVRNHYRPNELFDLTPTQSRASLAFPDSGYYVMRYDDHILVFDCGPIGMKGLQLRTHGHSDLLSFVFSVYGKPFIVDIGSGTYTESKELHDYFRSTAGHNTVTVDGNDQCGLSTTWVFRKHPSYRLIEWFTSDQDDSVCGMHSGFHPMIHQRRITMHKSKDPIVRILDEIIGKGEHEVTSRMHLHPSVEVDQLDENRINLRNGETGLKIRFCCPIAPCLSIRDGLYSPDYGVVQNTKVIELTVKHECPVLISAELEGKRSR